MRWSLVDADRLDPLIRFLGPREAGCVAFTRRLIDRGRIIVPPRRRYRILVRLAGDRITGAILQDTSGLYYPVIDPACPGIEPDAIRLLERGSKRLYSIMGIGDDVLALETAFERPVKQTVDYHLMVQSQPAIDTRSARLPRGLAIHTATVDDADRLFGIQKKYELEEVLLPGSIFRDDACMHHLVETLRREVTLYATLDGIAIAKVGTNARGIFFDQVGGVFTEPHLRGRGIATLLMERLLETIAADRKSGTLFVKKENGAALRMYSNLGFRLENEFRISYYG